MWRRYTPNTSRSFDPIIRTNHSPSSGSAIGREGLPRPAFDRTLTNRTTSGRDGSAPKGFSLSKRIRSLPWQNAICASKGSFRRSSARKFARDPGFRTISVPAAPTFTTPYEHSSVASILGRNVLCPPTLIPRKKTIRAMLSLWTPLLLIGECGGACRGRVTVTIRLKVSGQSSPRTTDLPLSWLGCDRFSAVQVRDSSLAAASGSRRSSS